MPQRDIFDSISPLDYRYGDERAVKYLSENAFTRHKCLVEVALVKTLAKRGICSEAVVQEVQKACAEITTEEVYAEENRVKHDIRALVNCIQRRVSKDSRRFVHMTATSYDISDTANALRYKRFVLFELVPAMDKLENVLIAITRREANNLQIGRTHGQHAVPITFGFAIAGYVSRWGSVIERVVQAAQGLIGKFSGAVGAYNASCLLFDDPEQFELEVLADLTLKPADHSTQIVQPEPLIRLVMECVLGAGVMANLADDMRNLQRTEIGEVGEEFGKDQVGSSTMAQKQNPINFENVKSCWKLIAPRFQTMLLDQISEHQRDLTNSASGRTYGEILAYTLEMVSRLTRTMSKLQVNKKNMDKNLAVQGDQILAEPLYILLAAAGHPDAHETVRKIAQDARMNGGSIYEKAIEDRDTVFYMSGLTDSQRDVLRGAVNYTGIAPKQALSVAQKWSREEPVDRTS